MTIVQPARWSEATTAEFFPTGLCRIGDQWAEGEAGRSIVDVNPTTEETLAVVATASQDQVGAAIAAARAQADGGEWSRLQRRDRRRLMTRIVELMDSHRAQLAEMLVCEIGCPLSLATAAQVAVAIEDFAWFAEAAGRSLDTGLPVAT